jgi:hypothetical protein
LSFSAGADVSLNIKTKIKGINNGNINPESAMEIGALFGFNYKLNKTYSLSARYSQGLQPFYIAEFYDYNIGGKVGESKYYMSSITVALHINILNPNRISGNIIN